MKRFGYFISILLFLSACSKKPGDSDTMEPAPSVSWYQFETYVHDTAQLESFKLKVVFNGHTVRMYSDASQTDLQYKGSFLNDTLARLTYIPSDAEAFASFEDSACIITLWDFTYKGRKI